MFDARALLRAHHPTVMIEPMSPSLAAELRGLMQEHLGDRSQRELARAAGVDQGTISRIMAGRNRNPSVATLTALAAALGSDDRERAAILARLRPAACMPAEVVPLRWPSEVDRLSSRQRRAVQRVVNTVVAALLEDEPVVEELAAGIEVDEQVSQVRSAQRSGA